MNHKKDGQLKRLRYCVLICESLSPNYDSASVPLSMIPVLCGDRQLRSHRLHSKLAERKQYRRSVHVLLQPQKWNWRVLPNCRQGYRSQAETQLHETDWAEKVDIERCSFGDVMREVRFRDLVSEDFLVVYADMITNVNLTQAITYHFDKKV
jgi:hypothetical protein